MPLAIDTTIGGASANSYLSVLDADNYFLARFTDGGWSALVTTAKEKALIAATSILDRENFRGVRVTATQRLKFPRLGVPKVDGRGYGQAYFGDFYLSTEIPQQLKDAVCEMSFGLISATFSENPGRRVSSWSSDDQSFTYEGDGRSAYALPPGVTGLLYGLIASNRIVRG